MQSYKNMDLGGTLILDEFLKLRYVQKTHGFAVAKHEFTVD